MRETRQEVTATDLVYTTHLSMERFLLAFVPARDNEEHEGLKLLQTYKLMEENTYQSTPRLKRLQLAGELLGILKDIEIEELAQGNFLISCVFDPRPCHPPFGRIHFEWVSKTESVNILFPDLLAKNKKALQEAKEIYSYKELAKRLRRFDCDGTVNSLESFLRGDPEGKKIVPKSRK